MPCQCVATASVAHSAFAHFNMKIYCSPQKTAAMVLFLGKNKNVANRALAQQNYCVTYSHNHVKFSFDFVDAYKHICSMFSARFGSRCEVSTRAAIIRSGLAFRLPEKCCSPKHIS